jgi:uncharacterized RDD family membrane protein YckC
MNTQAAKQVIDYEIATSYRRVVARLIDLGVGNFVFLFASGLFAEIFRLLFNISDSAFGTLMMVIWLVCFIAYDIVMHRIWGKTLGKMILGMKVVDINGDKLGWGMCILRAFLTYLFAFGIIFLIVVTASIFGWIFIGSLGKTKRFPHEKATRSFVVREIKGQLKKSEIPTDIQTGKPTPLAAIDRLYQQGIITEEEYERKKEEIAK